MASTVIEKTPLQQKLDEFGQQLSKVRRLYLFGTTCITMPRPRHIKASHHTFRYISVTTSRLQKVKKSIMPARDGRFGKDPIRFNSMYFVFNLIQQCIITLLHHSFNATFTNCESVQRIILRFINTF